MQALDNVRVYVGAGVLLLVVGVALWWRAVGVEDGTAAERERVADSTVAVWIARAHTGALHAIAAKRALAAAHVATARADSVDVVTHETVRIVHDSTLAVQLTPGGPPTLVAVPAAVVARIVADSVLIVAQAVEIHASALTIAALDTVVASDSVVIVQQQSEIAALQHDHHPWLTWRGGAVLGAIGTAAAVIALHALVR